MKFILSILTAVIFSFSSQQASSQGGAKMIEKVGKTPGQLNIPYEKWQLPNGMIVLIHEDHSDPIVYTDVTYHVGSNREQVGRSGFEIGRAHV